MSLHNNAQQFHSKHLPADYERVGELLASTAAGGVPCGAGGPFIVARYESSAGELAVACEGPQRRIIAVWAGLDAEQAAVLETELGDLADDCAAVIAALTRRKPRWEYREIDEDEWSGNL